MKERLNFQETVLVNGIKVYGYPYDVSFAMIRVIIPLGTAHNQHPILPGSFHLLEHMVLNRGAMFPELHSFKQFIGLNGGYNNAWTFPFETMYEVDVPATIFQKSFEGILSQIFDPIFNLADLENEKNIIANERRRKERWYTGTDELSQYLHSIWKSSSLYPIEQIFGSDEDLTKINLSYLTNLHDSYFCDKIIVLLGGNYDEKFALKKLSEIKTSPQILSGQTSPFEWKKREYHEIKMDSVSRHLYCYGGITNNLDWKEQAALTFILSFLGNHIHGPLYNWLRVEKGWVYELTWFLNYETQGRWHMAFPLNNKAQVVAVREELHGRIQKSLEDKRLVCKEINRVLSKSLFLYQKLNDFMNHAFEFLSIEGRIFTEEEIAGAIQSFSDVKYLLEIYEKHMSPIVTGEFLALPKTESK